MKYKLMGEYEKKSPEFCKIATLSLKKYKKKLRRYLSLKNTIL